jgi:SAM-dependent methyltransferase
MMSDLRVVAAPLDKHACDACGLVARDAATDAEHVFTSGYGLYDHPPGAPREDERQRGYAEWIAAHAGGTPASVLDIGCGNGSLLLALRSLWPAATLRGVDLSRESVARARSAGVDAACGSAATVPEPAQLVVSVNVLEHVQHPRSFLQQAGAAVARDGNLVVICPDGSEPWLELLMLDHLWSLAPRHLASLAAAAGFEVAAFAQAPPSLGRFQLVRLRRAGQFDRPAPPNASGAALAARREYLQAWAGLDGTLVQRAAGSRSVVCFGIGEAAGLLRAYAPAAWQRVTRCVADLPEETRFGDLPVEVYDGCAVRDPVMLAVRPGAQPALARRLEEAGCRVIRWDDVVAA